MADLDAKRYIRYRVGTFEAILLLQESAVLRFQVLEVADSISVHLDTIRSGRDHGLRMNGVASSSGKMHILVLIKGQGHVEVEHWAAVRACFAVRLGLALRLLSRILASIGAMKELALKGFSEFVVCICLLLFRIVGGEIEAEIEVEEAGKILFSHGGHVVEAIWLRP